MSLLLRILLTFALLTGATTTVAGKITANWEEQAQVTLTEGAVLNGTFSACRSYYVVARHAALLGPEAEDFFMENLLRGLCVRITGNVKFDRFISPVAAGNGMRRCIVQIRIQIYGIDLSFYTSLSMAESGGIKIRRCSPNFTPEIAK